MGQALRLHRGEVSDLSDVTLNVAVFVRSSDPVLLAPPLADHVTVEVTLLCVVLLDLPAREVLNLEVGEGDVKNEIAASDRVESNVHLIVFKSILAEDGQSYRAVRTVKCLIIMFLNRLLVLFIDREID